ncbi:Os04g0117700 [Oryza sativa Japonica Group]|uniref:Os04g0117700 protein n=1 Tax=Oryza sativa subsp. japonica TaxID=39947 RepID=A0A0P0W6M6_ORYSJ|nr:Os04g0117700 [Oryza sativa Japonica Group]
MPAAPYLEETGIPRCSPEMAAAATMTRAWGRAAAATAALVGGARGVGSRGGDGDPRDAARWLVALQSGSSSGGTVRATRTGRSSRGGPRRRCRRHQIWSSPPAGCSPERE